MFAVCAAQQDHEITAGRASCPLFPKTQRPDPALRDLRSVSCLASPLPHLQASGEAEPRGSPVLLLELFPGAGQQGTGNSWPLGPRPTATLVTSSVSSLLRRGRPTGAGSGTAAQRWREWPLLLLEGDSKPSASRELNPTLGRARTLRVGQHQFRAGCPAGWTQRKPPNQHWARYSGCSHCRLPQALHRGTGCHPRGDPCRGAPTCPVAPSPVPAERLSYLPPLQSPALQTNPSILQPQETQNSFC